MAPRSPSCSRWRVADMALQEQRLAQLRAYITEITPAAAEARRLRGAVLLDVREPDEVAEGSPVGAVRLGRGFLEFRIEAIVPDPTSEILVLCASGGRSLFVADGLARMGYRSVAHPCKPIGNEQRSSA